VFTGIVEGVARVRSVEERGGMRRLVLEPPGWDALPEVKSSVSVAGVCLTVAAHEKGALAFDVIAETLRCSSLGGLAEGDPVNVERSLKVGDHLDGHFVQGHVDGTGEVLLSEQRPGETWVRVGVSRELLDGLIHKGSVAIDGVSLTVAELDEGSFSVALIPETLSRTTLGKAKAGDTVNIEVDLLGKWVRRIMEQHGGGARS